MARDDLVSCPAVCCYATYAERDQRKPLRFHDLPGPRGHGGSTIGGTGLAGFVGVGTTSGFANPSLAFGVQGNALISGNLTATNVDNKSARYLVAFPEIVALTGGVIDLDKVDGKFEDAFARVFAQLAREFPTADGPYTYIAQTTGKLPAYIAIWCYWVSCWITNAALAIGLEIAARDEQAWIAELAPDPVTDPVGHTAFVHAHPRWIAQAFADAGINLTGCAIRPVGPHLQR